MTSPGMWSTVLASATSANTSTAAPSMIAASMANAMARVTRPAYGASVVRSTTVPCTRVTVTARSSVVA